MASATSWYLSVGNKVDTIDAKLEAVSIAMSEWQRLEHMSFEELEAKRTDFKTPWDVGDKYKVSVQLGEQGYFKDGVCHPKSGKYAAEASTCFQNTIMTVYSNGETEDSKSPQFTTRTLPLSTADSFYNKKQIDEIVVKMEKKVEESAAVVEGGIYTTSDSWSATDGMGGCTYYWKAVYVRSNGKLYSLPSLTATNQYGKHEDCWYVDNGG